MIADSAMFCSGCGGMVERASEFSQPCIVYDAASFSIAKEYIEAVRSARGLSIAGLVLMLAVIPVTLLFILVPFAFLLSGGMGIASCICAAVSTSRLSRTRKLPVIAPGRIDPVSYATYFKSLKDAKTSKTMNTAVYIMAALAVVAIIGFLALLVLLGGAILDASGGFSGPAYYY